MQQAEAVLTRIIVYTFNFVGAVGLFGAENSYVRVNVDIEATTSDSIYEEVGWDPAVITYGVDPHEYASNYYYGAYIYEDLDTL